MYQVPRAASLSLNQSAIQFQSIMIAGRAAADDDDPTLPIRTAACIGIGLPGTCRRAPRTGMSITKKGGKGANTASGESKNPEGFVGPKSTTRNPRVKTVIQFMEANLQRKISLPELADAANLSRSYLCNLFKTETGLSPGEYFRRLRMEKASRLLATTLLSVKQVMGMTGYDNRSDFVLYFRRYFDCTPTEYRNRAYNSDLTETNRKPT
jgi:AraC-like DNA-binding protein